MTVTDLLRAELEDLREARVERGTTDIQRDARNWLRAYVAALVVADALVAILVGVLLLARDSGLPLWLAPALVGSWVFVTAVWGGYRGNVLASGVRDLRPVGLAGLTLFAVAPLIPLIGLGLVYKPALVVALASITLASGVARWSARSFLNTRRRVGRCTQGVFVVGDAAAVSEMVQRVRRASISLVPVGVAVPREQIDQAALLGVPVVPFDNELSTLDTAALLAGMRDIGADGFLLTPGRDVDNDVLRRVARACEWAGLSLFLAPSSVDVASSAVITPVSGLPILAMSRPGPSGAGRLAKALFDRLGAALGLVVLAPLFLVAVVAVRMDSRGPALFRQIRVGQNGVPFKIVKFRTMHVGAEALVDTIVHLNENDGNKFKIREDPRVTRLGRVLRSTSLDELPQLWNVVLGHMSLVGPRPPLPSEVEAYTAAEQRRLLVKPGMTGLWQVGGRSHLSWVDTVRLDLRYVESWSLALDLRILARTLPEVVRRNGAF